MIDLQSDDRLPKVITPETPAQQVLEAEALAVAKLHLVADLDKVPLLIRTQAKIKEKLMRNEQEKQLNNLGKSPEAKVQKGPVRISRRDFGRLVGLTALAGVLAGCGTPTDSGINTPTLTKEGTNVSPTATEISPTISPTVTKEVTPTPEQEVISKIVELTNTSQEIISKEIADKVNSLTSICRAELSYFKPEEKKPYFPSMTGMSIQGIETIELNTKFKFGYCDTEIYGYTDEEKASASFLMVFLGENKIILPTLNVKAENITQVTKEKVSENLKEGETIEFVRLVPRVSPEGKILWPDTTLKLAVSTDGSLHLKQKAEELPANTKEQDKLFPMVTAIRQKDGTLRYEITDPVEGRAMEGKTMIIQAGKEGEFTGFAEIAEWQNTPEEVIEGKQFYSVYHVIGEGGKEYLLAARAGKTPEEALADPYSRLAEAKVNEEGKWVWEKKEMPLMDIKDLKQYVLGNCKLRGSSGGWDEPTLTYYGTLAKQIGITFGPPPGFSLTPHPATAAMIDIEIKTDTEYGYCWFYAAGMSGNEGKAVYESRFGGFNIIPVKNITTTFKHW
jgi:hypothetical protein